MEGVACEKCKEGSFYLETSNPEGCTKCFCFGKTNRCTQAYLRPFNVSMLKNDAITLNTVEITPDMIKITPWDDREILVDNTTAHVVFNDVTDQYGDERLTYFGTSGSHNNHLTSYGGYLTFKILFSNGPFGKAIIAPDVILKSKTLAITHQSYAQPASRQIFDGGVHLIESNFNYINGLPVTREHFMSVLLDLEGVYIRASYWEQGLETTLSDVYLSVADENPENPYLYQELPIEKCECPPGYMGFSCESCAPGYYRDATNGPYGHCIPCSCNGHAKVGLLSKSNLF